MHLHGPLLVVARNARSEARAIRAALRNPCDERTAGRDGPKGVANYRGRADCRAVSDFTAMMLLVSPSHFSERISPPSNRSASSRLLSRYQSGRVRLGQKLRAKR